MSRILVSGVCQYRAYPRVTAVGEGPGWARRLFEATKTEKEKRRRANRRRRLFLSSRSTEVAQLRLLTHIRTVRGHCFAKSALTTMA